MTRIVFMDTETGGLAPEAEVWDFAAIIREPGSEDQAVQFFIEHDREQVEKELPEPFYSDYRARFNPRVSYSKAEAAQMIRNITRGAHIVGAVPNFDTEHLALLLRANGLEPDWHYHLVDVENLAIGWLHGAIGTGAIGVTVPELPWDSDVLSSAVGVDPAWFVRHTAMGDAEWARAIYDAVTSGS